MPFLDEGSFLYMPTTMPHASIGTVKKVISQQNISIKNIHEVTSVVGKAGRADSALDPAPVSMIETVIDYNDPFLKDANGELLTFRFDNNKNDYFRDISGKKVNAADGKPYIVKGKFIRDKNRQLIEAPSGRPFPLWRPPLDPSLNEDRKEWKGIQNPDDIWKQIQKKAQFPGVTSAPMLQPISTRIVMLQTGMRSPIGIKIYGDDLSKIEQAGIAIEEIIRDLPAVDPDSVSADRIIGKPYIHITPDRLKLARFSLDIKTFNQIVEAGIGGMSLTYTIEGRNRFAVSARYMREFRDNIESIKRLPVKISDNKYIPLSQIADIAFKTGPVSIKSEDGFLVGYVLFDKADGYSESQSVEFVDTMLRELILNGELSLPSGITFAFDGTYKNQQRAEKRFRVIIPITLAIIFLLIYLEFKSYRSTLIVFSSILIAWSGGFIMLWLYSQSWFMDFHLFGVNMRDMFHITPFNLSVAVWVGFLALFGIATDDGLMMGTFISNAFKKEDDTPAFTKIVKASMKRVRACLMTSATTILALLPILSSSGRGSDIMIPMAIPSFGGMFVVLISLFSVPVLFSFIYSSDKGKQSD